MKSHTADIVYWAGLLDVRKDALKVAIESRDLSIYLSFKAGKRQADIAMYAGLSPSTIKHIIAAQKKL